MKRNAIILEKHLSVGQVGNVAAILMGQLAQLDTKLFSKEPVIDKDQVQHAGIQYSTVILKAGSGQIANLAKLLVENAAINAVVFTATGQSLNNQFEIYAQSIKQSRLEETGPVGIAISGEDSEVRQLTKKFSLLK
ncbi:DUF2000 family protein [Pediococcus ethanolidurans]|uniref:DUF2000 family protein n=1 Tax=Pediococcus ethanolidurans TaxID=319653 RepID=UPI0029557918|nr:DUF2000 family protein [Pediococcus ethanolidurans]MDV7719931.1 DUF2000 family protein [Pediococcus ethanolidurans]